MLGYLSKSIPLDLSIAHSHPFGGPYEVIVILHASSTTEVVTTEVWIFSRQCLVDELDAKNVQVDGSPLERVLVEACSGMSQNQCAQRCYCNRLGVGRRCK